MVVKIKLEMKDDPFQSSQQKKTKKKRENVTVY